MHADHNDDILIKYERTTMHSCDNLTRFNPSSPPPPRRIRIEKFLSMTVLLFSNNDAVASGDSSRSGARAHRNQVLWPCKTRKCFVCLFFSVPANGLKWCTSRSALICVGNPDQIARRHIGNLTNSGHSALKAHVCCGLTMIILFTNVSTVYTDICQLSTSTTYQQ